MIYNFIKKEILLEWRQRYAINGILLYLVSTIFICYLSFNVKANQLNPITWNTLFWIIILFTSISAIAKSFIQEKQERYLYYYWLLKPQVLITARIIYNGLLMLILGLAGFIIYAIVLGNPVQDVTLFIVNLVLASISFSSALTMISAIASKANSNQTLMAILGFPVILPMLLMIIKVSKNALDGLPRDASYHEIATLFAINLIIGAVSYLLFPYIWRS
ncbi:heme exporter protein CcmB [Fulvivirga maritima]|uniref:heme exporter protein CcmB n=1 Tax=Fulvivirga maritima TaxID=2904247 RepID=UPI001F3D9DCC|nr:heme exporter protein CcmB [Fulvivirga maritima]UII27958.1 heme exporter protein CcmB [Fulvivirga maritima]